MGYEDTITLFIFLLGSLTVTLSLIVAIKFNRYKNKTEGGAYQLSNAISWQLIGEAIIGFGTLAFSSAAYFGILSSWPIEVQSMIRFVMFLSTSITTWHLLKTLQRLGNK